MSVEENDGLHYLQALKQAEETVPPVVTPEEPAATTLEQTIAGTPDSGQSERRRSPRYKCEGSMEMREEGREVGTWAAFTDISLYGCYIEAMATLPVGTALDMKLEAKGFRIQAKGTVRVNYPYLGMGIAFTEMPDDDRARLKELLRSLSQPSVILSPSMPPMPMARLLESVPVIIDPASAVRVMVDFFERHPMLTRDEFFQLLHKSQSDTPNRLAAARR